MRLHLFVLVTLSLLIAGCDTKPTPAEQAAVDAVWDQYVKGMTASLDEFTAKANGARVDPWTRAHLVKVKHYRGIDVSRCPKPFQQAWSAYMTQLQAYDPTASMSALGGNAADLDKLINAERPLKEAEAALAKSFERYSPTVASEFAKQREYEASRKSSP